MPGFNGSGPEGKGPRTGRGDGNCKPLSKADNNDVNAVEENGELLGVGRGGRPRGGGRGYCYGGGRRRRGWRYWNSGEDKQGEDK